VQGAGAFWKGGGELRMPLGQRLVPEPGETLDFPPRRVFFAGGWRGSAAFRQLDNAP